MTASVKLFVFGGNDGCARLLSGLPGRLRLVQEIGSTLGVGGRGEDGPLVIAKHFEPRGDIGRMIFAYLRRDPQVGTEEGGAQLGDQFFHAVAFIAPSLTSEFTGKA